MRNHSHKSHYKPCSYPDKCGEQYIRTKSLTKPNELVHGGLLSSIFDDLKIPNLFTSLFEVIQKPCIDKSEIGLSCSSMYNQDCRVALKRTLRFTAVHCLDPIEIITDHMHLKFMLDYGDDC